MWILAAKLPNSDLNFAVDFSVDFFVLFFPRKKARKNPPKNPPQNSPGTLFGKIPLGFLQKPFLDRKSQERAPKFGWILGRGRGLLNNLSGPVLCDTARLSQRYPPIARYGVLVSQHGQLGAIPPPPFPRVPPWRACEVWRCDTPPQKGYLSDTGAIPYENKAN